MQLGCHPVAEDPIMYPTDIYLDASGTWLCSRVTCANKRQLHTHILLQYCSVVVCPSECAAARLPRLWVRIPPRVWMLICCECCALSGRGPCNELTTRPEDSYLQ
jgi:hypothetical protein